MDWTRAWIIVGMLSACGPQVSVSEDGDDGSDGGTSDASSTGNGPSTTTVSSSSGDPTSSTVADVATTDTPVLDFGTTLPDLSGTHLFAVAAVIDPAHPFQWLATISQTAQPGGAALTIELQSLALDPGATTTPRTPVGDPLVLDVLVDEEGGFGVELPQTMIPGAANPITGSDIVGTMILQGNVLDESLWCGSVTGMITQPLMLDLTGSTFAGTRLLGDGELPGDPIPAACP